MKFFTLLLLLIALGQPAFNQSDLTSPYGQIVKKAEAHYRAADYRAAPAACSARLPHPFGSAPFASPV